VDSISSVEDSIMPIVIKSTFDVACEVWDDAFLQKVIIGFMATVGTNMILQDDLECRNWALFCLICITILEKYGERGEYGPAYIKALIAGRDLDEK
jgi:hypothetical protein